MKDLKEEYNAIPVYYCSECLSLKVITLDGQDFCDKCGNINIKQCSIYEWEELYEEQNSDKYLNEIIN